VIEPALHQLSGTDPRKYALGRSLLEKEYSSPLPFGAAILESAVTATSEGASTRRRISRHQLSLSRRGLESHRP